MYFQCPVRHFYPSFMLQVKCNLAVTFIALVTGSTKHFFFLLESVCSLFPLNQTFQDDRSERNHIVFPSSIKCSTQPLEARRQECPSWWDSGGERGPSLCGGRRLRSCRKTPRSKLRVNQAGEGLAAHLLIFYDIWEEPVYSHYSVRIRS